MKKICIFPIIACLVFGFGCNSKNSSASNKESVAIEKFTGKQETKLFVSDFFEFDLSFTDFNHAKTQFGTILFNEDGDFESVNNVSNTIVIGRLPKMSEAAGIEFIKSLYPKGDHPYEEIISTKIQYTSIGDYEATVLDTPYVFDDVEGILYLAILKGDKWSLAFRGQAFGNRRLELLEKYKKTVKSIRLK